MGKPMKNYISLFLLMIFSGSIFISTGISAQSREKLAQTGFKFLSVSTDARVAGMGDAVTSLHGSSTAMLYNPAGMADLDRYMEISFGQTNWIADINYIHATAAFNPFADYYGVFGVSIVAVDYGAFQGTVRADNEKGYLDVGSYYPSALAFGIGYARSLSEKFAIGANVKFVRQSITDYGKIGINSTGGYKEKKFETDVFAFDFGLIYRTGYKSLNLGMSIRNFSEELKYEEEGFQLPLTFRIGASINAMDFLDMDQSTHSFLVSVDAVNPRDFSEQLTVGGEYTFQNTFSLRAGYTFPTDESGITVGVGLAKQEIGDMIIGVDYAYTDFGIFDNVHRFSIHFGY